MAQANATSREDGDIRPVCRHDRRCGDRGAHETDKLQRQQQGLQPFRQRPSPAEQRALRGVELLEPSAYFGHIGACLAADRRGCACRRGRGRTEGIKAFPLAPHQRGDLFRMGDLRGVICYKPLKGIEIGAQLRARHRRLPRWIGLRSEQSVARPDLLVLHLGENGPEQTAHLISMTYPIGCIFDAKCDHNRKDGGEDQQANGADGENKTGPALPVALDVLERMPHS